MGDQVGEHVYAVHATRPEEVGSVEVIFHNEPSARAYAASRSGDHRVLAVSVTEFVLGELGSLDDTIPCGRPTPMTWGAC